MKPDREYRIPFPHLVHPATVLWTHPPRGRRRPAAPRKAARRPAIRAATMAALGAVALGLVLVSGGRLAGEGGGTAVEAPAATARAG